MGIFGAIGDLLGSFGSDSKESSAPKYYIDLVDPYGNIIETGDEVFDDEYEAEAYASESNSAFAQGAEDLGLSGRDYMDPDCYTYVVREEW